MKHYVVYSHGFGVRKDDRGLMTDIAGSMPEFEHILFDYNELSDSDKTMRAASLSDQADKLNSQIDLLDPDATVDVVAHSQGCISTAIAQPERVRHIVFITPPDNTDGARISEYFGSRPGSHMDMDGESRIPRRDGTTTIIPAEYWSDLKSIEVVPLYAKLAELCEITFIAARDDEVLDGPDFTSLDGLVDLRVLPGNHDFTGVYRPTLLKTIFDVLAV